VFDRLLALWDRHGVRLKLPRALMSGNGGSFIKLSHRSAGDNAARPGGPKSCL